MTIDREDVEATTEQREPSALVLKAVAAVAACHPELSTKDHQIRGSALVERGALGLSGEGEIIINPKGVEYIKIFAPRMLGGEAPLVKLSRVQRAKASEAALAAKALASRQPASPPAQSVAKRFNDRVAADPALRGDRPSAREARIRLREQLYAEAGINPDGKS
jgi:hypothetical protein